VIVLDAGISALALVDTQIRSDYVPIVVVWPKDAYTPAAEARVEPTTAFLELGNAVRRVAERHAEPIRVPEASGELAEPEETPHASVDRRRGGRARQALVLAAAWTIALTALAAIGLAVPSAFRALEPRGTLHPVRDRAERAITVDREAPGGGHADLDPEPRCDRPGQLGVDPQPGHGERRGRGNGCALGQGGHGTPGNRGNGNGKGRPDDPGKGSGRGDANAGRPPQDPQDEDEGKAGRRANDDPVGSGGEGSGGDNDPPGEDEQGRGKAGRSGGDAGGSPGQGKGSGKGSA
jgi:hypothetical protein